MSSQEHAINVDSRVEHAHQSAVAVAKENPSRALSTLNEARNLAEIRYKDEPSRQTHLGRITRDEGVFHARLALYQNTQHERLDAAENFATAVSLLGQSASILGNLKGNEHLLPSDTRYLRGERLATATMTGRVLGARAIALPGNDFSDGQNATSAYRVGDDILEEGRTDNAYYLASHIMNKGRYEYAMQRGTAGPLLLARRVLTHPDFRGGVHRKDAIRTMARMSKEMRTSPDGVKNAIRKGSL